MIPLYKNVNCIDILLSDVDEVHHGHHLPELHSAKGDVDGLLMVVVLTQQLGQERTERQQCSEGTGTLTT